MREILCRYREALLDGTFSLGRMRGDRAENLHELLFAAPDGSLRFSDVNYECQNRADWNTLWHLSRLTYFALAAAKGEES